MENTTNKEYKNINNNFEKINKVANVILIFAWITIIIGAIVILFGLINMFGGRNMYHYNYYIGSYLLVSGSIFIASSAFLFLQSYNAKGIAFISKDSNAQLKQQQEINLILQEVSKTLKDLKNNNNIVN